MALALAIQLFLITDCLAQSWQKLATFDGYICLAKFLDANTGFVALGLTPGWLSPQPVGVYKTTDGGQSWVQCTTPSGYSGEIGDILMTDSLNGWLAMTCWGGGVSALWNTTNAGLTWNESPLQGSGTSVAITPSAMIVTDLLNQGHISTDGGNTFTSSLPSSTNGITFSDSIHGAISDFRSQNWLYTSDGGITWDNASLNVESWSVASIAGSPDFYAAPEGPTDGSPYSPQIFKSTDFGKEWNSISPMPYKVTGHFAGLGEQYLFCQVSTDGLEQDPSHKGGFYCSTDSGQSWFSIGGPSAYHDSRFSVIQSCGELHIFGFDQGSQGTLFEYTMMTGIGGPNALTLEDTTRMSLSSCIALDTSISLAVVGCSSSKATLDSLWLSGSSAFSIADDRSVPRTLAVLNSIIIAYSSLNTSDTAELHLQYDFGSGLRDTSITLVGKVPNTIASRGLLHRASADSYFGYLDSLALLVDVSPALNLDSLLPYVTDIQFTYSWDSSVASYASYVPPNGWLLSSIVPHGNSVDIDITNTSALSTSPLSLGTALFRSRSQDIASSWVELPRFVIMVGGHADELCVADNEDSHWAIKSLGVESGVYQETTATSEIEMYPNPASNELFIRNSNQTSAQITIYDALGRKLLETTSAPNSTDRIDIASLAPGSYVVVCSSSGREFVRSFCKLY